MKLPRVGVNQKYAPRNEYIMDWRYAKSRLTNQKTMALRRAQQRLRTLPGISAWCSRLSEIRHPVGSTMHL